MPTKATNAIPRGHRTITPHLSIENCEQAIAWYKKALGAEEVMPPAKGPDGMIWHAELKIGDSIFHVNDPLMGGKGPKALGGTPCNMLLYVEDCDAVFNRAVKEGAKPTMPIADQFWGDRWGNFDDPFGCHWSVATHKEDLTPQEMKQRSEEFQKQMAAMKGKN
jgi:uncharacterized glyoxalase superfamily protein PhnB